MASRKINTCDRPGCGIESTGDLARVSVWVREWPLGDLAAHFWDLCDKCEEELRQARRDVDLAFGERLRPVAGPTRTDGEGTP